MAKVNNFIVIGFDRSGTSAISRTLAMHPDIELIFRPFNSGNIRKLMYKILNDKLVSAEDIDFFKKLENNYLENAYIKSPWHEKYSSTKQFKEGKIHLLITNLNHFTVEWVKTNFPKIKIWAIWRDPLDILASCMRNNFYGEWYSDALPQVIQGIKEKKYLRDLFGKYCDQLSNDTKKTAFLVAVRNYYLFYHIEKYINYEIFKTEPNRELKKVLDEFGLSSFDFRHYLKVDLNSVPGKTGFNLKMVYRSELGDFDMAFAEEIFQPLFDLVEKKFGKNQWNNPFVNKC